MPPKSRVSKWLLGRAGEECSSGDVHHCHPSWDLCLEIVAKAWVWQGKQEKNCNRFLQGISFEETEFSYFLNSHTPFVKVGQVTEVKSPASATIMLQLCQK